MNDARPVTQLRDRQGDSEVDIVRAADVTMANIGWLWPQWIAQGKLHLLAGDAGVGKTTLALALAAIVSRGGRWPDGAECAPANVLIWTGEDDLEDTTVPRLAAAGADLNRLFLICGVGHGRAARPFDPAVDLKTLTAEADRIGSVALLIVDPLVSAVVGDSHKNVEVRRALQPLVDLGRALRCAVLGVTHFSKGGGSANPLLRVTGSIAFGAVARVVLVAGKQRDSEERILARAKSNVGPDDGGVAYHIEFSEASPGHPRAARVMWGDMLEGSARDLLADEPNAGADGSIESAKDWLTRMLANGPAAVSELRVAAASQGHSWRTVERSKQALGIRSRKDAPDGGWRWFMPTQDVQDRQDRQPDGGGVGGIDVPSNGEGVDTSNKAPLQWT